MLSDCFIHYSRSRHSQRENNDDDITPPCYAVGTTTSKVGWAPVMAVLVSATG